MGRSLFEIIDEIGDLLRECGWEKQASWYKERVEKLSSGNAGSPEYVETLRNIRRSALGMGSFSDIPLTPKMDPTASPIANYRQVILQLSNRQIELASALATAIDEELSRHGR